MLGSVSIRLAVAAALALSIPVGVAAQAPSLEGTDWQLIWYPAETDLAAVPWSVDASLRLEDGVASGRAGCNGFSGSYSLEGESLTFDGPLAVTATECPRRGMSAEEGYLAALPQAATWWIDESLVDEDAALELYDAAGETILLFALPVVGLTQADVDALARQLDEQQALVDRLGERVDDIRIGILRDRIKELEVTVDRLQSRSSTSSSGAGAGFNAAEKVLLEAVPAKLARKCTPRRSDNPAGTVAALQCPPGDPGVRDMAYYLMSEDDAWKVWRQRMKQWGVPQGFKCWQGKPSQVASTGGLELSGCYVDDNGRANLRYAIDATECRQLDAGKKHLKSPAIYVAVLGEDDDIKQLTRWAESRQGAGAQDLVVPIRRLGAKWDPTCPR